MKWLLVPALFVSCGSQAREAKGIVPALRPFVAMFIEDALEADVAVDAMRVKGLGAMSFGQLAGTSIGVCYTSTWPDGHMDLEIVIDPQYFTEATYCTQKALLYHELGHCLLGLGHSASEDSVMYPYIAVDVSASCEPTNESIRVMFLDAKHM